MKRKGKKKIEKRTRDCEREAEAMQERHLYSLLGFLLFLVVGYLNWSGSSNNGTGFRIRIPIPWLQPKMSFIAVNGTRFFDLGSNSTVYVNGWNSYWMISSGSPGFVKEMLKRGSDMGMTVCRTWAFNDAGPNALQISPGRLDERIFQELDYVIYEARNNNVRLILCLVNNLNAFGGKAQYIRWAQAAGANVTLSADSFFSHPMIKGYYKNYVKAILTRKNSFSGIRYCDEPAIFAWELMNEPRCISNLSAPLLQAWIVEMASYVKSLDQKHLVTVGLEGFYSHERTERLGVNPGNWASSIGTDFIQNSAIEQIDFASVHAYPDSWIPKASLEEKIKYLSNWVDSHVNDSEHVLKKPVLFSEVGSHVELKKNGLYDRDILLKTVYDKIYESAKKGQAGAGALIWQLMVEGMQGYRDEFSLVAREHPSTYKLIAQQSCRLNNLFKEKGETNISVGRQCSALLP